MSPDEELIYLREENAKLRALMELREDRSDLEKFSVESRNKLILLFSLVVLLLGGSLAASLVVRRDLDQDLKAAREINQRLSGEQSFKQQEAAKQPR